MAAFPVPTCGEMTIFIGGPGRGESTVVVFPDGKCMVVDVWARRGFNFPLEICQQCGIERVDLAVLTHPDHDHIRGFPELAETLDIERVWRYPPGTIRDVLSAVCRKLPDNSRLQELRDSLEVVDELARRNRLIDADIETASWPRGESAYEAHCIAPCPADKAPFYERVNSLVEVGATGVRLSERGRAFFEGRNRYIDLRANALSLAVVIEWEGYRILLAGDVEAPNEPYRGWNGIIHYLEEDGRSHLITSLKGIKVAHHGSGAVDGDDGAFSAAAWELHTEDGPIDFGLITPYRMGGSAPPQTFTLKALLDRIKDLGVTASAEAHGWSRVLNSGWRETSVEPLPNLGDTRWGKNYLAVVMDAKGDIQRYASEEAKFFRSSY